MIERLHRLFLEVVKGEINKLNIKDITNVQALVLYNIGEKNLTVGDLTNHGYYLGSNVSYNLRKMVENGYILQKPSEYDKRSSSVNLTQKGMKMFKIMDGIFENQSKYLIENNVDERMINNLRLVLVSMEKYLNKID